MGGSLGRLIVQIILLSSSDDEALPSQPEPAIQPPVPTAEEMMPLPPPRSRRTSEVPSPKPKPSAPNPRPFLADPEGQQSIRDSETFPAGPAICIEAFMKCDVGMVSSIFREGRRLPYVKGNV